MFEQAFNSFYRENTSKYLVFEQESTGLQAHLTHLEELILTLKKPGLDMAVRFINELVSIFQGNVDSKMFATVKYDGAPAIITGYNPENNQFFVATKSFKPAYTTQDITLNYGHSPGLAEKLKLALLYLPEVIKQGIYQGDFMFSKSDLIEINYNNERLITFKPNTITYAVDADSSLGKRILNSQIGIIFHTKYIGNEFDKTKLMKTPNVSVNEFNQTANVFVDDAKFKDMSGTVTLTNDEEQNVKSSLDKILKAGNVVQWDSLPDFFYREANTFINTLIRQGRFVDDPDKLFEEFITWYNNREQKAIDTLKTERGKGQREEIKNKNLEFLNQNKMSIVNIFYLTKLIADVKRIFIDKYNSAINTKQFLAQPDGTLKVTKPEGVVAVDHEGNSVKLVDRLEFSKANFAIPKELKFKQPQ